jgi:hypothetical protein
MRKYLFVFAFLLVCCVFSAINTKELTAQNIVVSDTCQWKSAEQWGNWTNGGYTIYNNIWGSGAGKQTVWANTYSNWGVHADHPATGGIKSYPNSEKVINKKLSELSKCTSNFSCTVPQRGSYNTAYDIWCNEYTYEIMLWMNWNGNVGPIAGAWGSDGKPVPDYSNVNVGGYTWNVYKGSNGSNAVFSFLITEHTNKGEVDVRDILNWIKSKAWFDDVTVYKVQLGWEITSSTGGLDFTINSYSVEAE